VALRARSFGTVLHYHNRTRLEPQREQGACYHASLDDLMRHSDVLCVCAPSAPELRGCVDARRLALLPRGALLVNVARGDLIDEAALFDAVETGRLGGVATDVFRNEPHWFPMLAHLENAHDMSARCCSGSCSAPPPVDPRYRKALWVALVLNALMFVVELGASWASGSVSLLADSIDFFGDAGNYAISLAVLGMAMPARSKAALFKAACMGAFGVFVLGKAAWSLQAGMPPDPATMGAVGFAALAVNAGVTLMLYRFRSGDANMRSVWICSRNDALGNIAVMLAALGVFRTGSAWPDILVAGVMGALALTGSWTVLKQAKRELRLSATQTPA
jgi:Co/Zn/Cd efflux system component